MVCKKVKVDTDTQVGKESGNLQAQVKGSTGLENIEAFLQNFRKKLGSSYSLLKNFWDTELWKNH